MGYAKQDGERGNCDGEEARGTGGLDDSVTNVPAPQDFATTDVDDNIDERTAACTTGMLFSSQPPSQPPHYVSLYLLVLALISRRLEETSASGGTTSHRCNLRPVTRSLVQGMLFEDWKKVVFTDEKRFSPDEPDGFQHYCHDLRKEPKVISRRSQGGGGVMV
ncbi:hypothetical protein Trydic_g12547 [Trypoxylus dichotomus]